MKSIFIYFSLMILSGAAFAQQTDNMMAVTSTQDTVYFSAPDSALRLELPPKTIRLFTTSQSLQKQLSGAYPGIKWVPYFKTPVQTVTDTVRTEVIIPTSDRPYIYMKIKKTNVTMIMASTGTLGSTVSVDRTITINGNPLPPTRWQSGVKPYLNTDPESRLFVMKAEESEEWVGWGVAGGIAGAVLALISAGVGNDNNDREIDINNPPEENKIKPATVIGMGMFAAGGIMVALNWDGSDKHLLDGIQVYNKNLAALRNESLPEDLYTEGK